MKSVFRHTLFSAGTKALALAVAGFFPGLSQAAPDLTGYTLSFSDEFDTMSIGWPSSNVTTKWTSKPAHGAGFGDATFSNQGAYEPGHPFSIVNSALRITCKQINGVWRSGLISSVCKSTAYPEGFGFSQAMGYWEARMKFPAGSGVWPGFWLLGMGRLKTVREQVAEIDIVEYYCRPIDQFSEVLHIWSPTGAKVNGQQYMHATGSNLTTAFHTYSVMIKDDFISYYWDGILKWQVATPPEAKKPMWMMAEYAIGAGWPIDAAAINNSYTDIDYIRVYAPPAGGTPVTLPAGIKKITAKISGKCLDGSGYSGSTVKQQPYTGANDQKWTVLDLGSGQHGFREVATTSALQVTGASSANGALIQIKSWASNLHQRWTVQTASPGYYRFVNVNSGKAMQVQGSSTADGANMEQYTLGTGANQEFAVLAP